MTLDVERELIEDAMKFTGITDEGILIREALAALVRREAAQRLIRLGGTMPDLDCVPRLPRSSELTHPRLGEALVPGSKASGSGRMDVAARAGGDDGPRTIAP